ncbi:MAG: sulfotransferase [Planctomycetota bacterium]
MSRLPNFVVIGAPRCGTTSLFHWLRQHPGVYLPVRKELHFFSYPILAAHCAGPGDREALAGLVASWDEYQAHYAGAREEAAVGEVSPSYLLHSSARHAIAERLGQVKVIALLRDPVEKAYSQHALLARQGREDLPFAAALDAEEERRRRGWGDLWWYAAGARYAPGIEDYAATFGRENVLVVRFEDLEREPRAALPGVLAFLGVDPGVPIDTAGPLNRAGGARFRLLSRILDGGGPAKRLIKRVLPERVRVPLRLRLSDWNTVERPPLDLECRRRLAARLADDVRRLERFLGRDLGWSV